MDETKVIQGLRDGNRIINNCNQDSWANYRILEALAAGNLTVISMVQEANRIYSNGDPNGAKNKHRQIIKYLENPAPVFPPSIKYFHVDALGLQNDVLDHAWEENQEEETFYRIDRFLEKCRMNGASAVGGFSHLHSGQPGHAHLNYKTPWQWEGGKINFDKPHPRYWHLNNRFLETVKKNDLRVYQQAFMREWYCAYFKKGNNVQGITGYQDPKALPYIMSFSRQLTQAQRDAGLAPGIKPFNEIMHSGSDSKGHWIANIHKAIWYHVEDLMDIKDFITDTSCSEFSSSQLCYHGKTNKCKNDSCEYYRIKGKRYKWKKFIKNKVDAICPMCGSSDVTRTYACPKCQDYLWDNLIALGRDVWREKHGCSIYPDLEIGHKSFNGFMRSGNWHTKWTEDGSDNPECKIVPIPGYKWRLGTAEQCEQMLVYTWNRCKNASRRKEFTWAIVPMTHYHILGNGIRAEYSVERVKAVEWEKMQMAQETYLRIHQS